MKPVLESNVIVNGAVLSSDDVTDKKVRCPACGSFTFELWPEGWDMHAGYKCKGLVASTPEDRKKEFKDKLLHLFR